MSVETELRALADANGGRLVPEAVVDAARDPDSPLHSHFTWDDTEAARQHRINQARVLIRTVRIDVKTTNYVIQAPAYVRDPAAGRSAGYIDTIQLRSDEDAAREVVVSEFARASAALRRARTVATALGITDQIDAAIGAIDRLNGEIQMGVAA